jgi:uroporphyrin-III C-methyltransferase
VTVYLVGAGPGDPELITLRGARLLAEAEVVVHDRLAAPVVALAGPDALLVDVGKSPAPFGSRSGHAAEQEEINRLLVYYGRRYQRVVRLKGGDPLVFALGAEELQALRDAGIPAEVVPGVSAVLAAPAAAGTPLTIRSIASSFTVLTGHEDPNTIPMERWRALAALGGTIEVLMGARTIGAIASCLVVAGMPGATPVVAVRSATTSDEVVAHTTLEGVGQLRLPAPVVYVIGEVAGYGRPVRAGSTSMSHRRGIISAWASGTVRSGGPSRRRGHAAGRSRDGRTGRAAAAAAAAEAALAPPGPAPAVAARGGRASPRSSRPRSTPTSSSGTSSPA